MQNGNGIITDKEMKNRRDDSELEKKFYSSSNYPSQAMDYVKDNPIDSENGQRHRHLLESVQNSHKPLFIVNQENGRNIMTTTSYDSLLAKEEIEVPRNSENGTGIATKHATEYADAMQNEEKVNFNKIFPIWNNTTTLFKPQLSESKFSEPEFSEPRHSSSPIADPSLKPPFKLIQKSKLHTNDQNEDNRLHTNDYNEDNMPLHQRCLRETNDPVLLAFLRKHNMSVIHQLTRNHILIMNPLTLLPNFIKMLTLLMTHTILLTHLKPRFIV